VFSALGNLTVDEDDEEGEEAVPGDVASASGIGGDVEDSSSIITGVFEPTDHVSDMF
jgi:hypothetical protein